MIVLCLLHRVDGAGEAGGEEVGVVAGADEGAAVHEGDAEVFAVGLVALELVGVDEFLDPEFRPVGLEVLADRDDVAAGLGQVGDGFLDLGFRFPEAYHDPRFDEDRLARRFGVPEDVQGGVVLRFVAHAGGEGADGLDVVVEDLGFGSEGEVQGC